MMNRFFTLLLAASCLTAVGQVIVPANCEAPTASAEVQFNDVRAEIMNNGGLWHNLDAYSGAYVVPADGQTGTMFAAGLWAGGIDEVGQLHVAAHLYGNNNDFYSGTISEADTGLSADCNLDAVFISQRSDVQTHIQYFQSLEQGSAEDDFPNGYTIPEYFFSWPATVNSGLDIAFVAPFIDFNQDGIYDPYQGDAPGYDLSNSTSCEIDGAYLQGDANAFWVNNDTGNDHFQSGGIPLGIEVRGQFWALPSENNTLNQTSFVTYEFLNRSNNSYLDFKASFYADVDLGGINDDFIGCDIGRSLGFVYNGDDFDEADAFSVGYGENPPAFGVAVFNGLKLPQDGLDNAEATLSGIGQIPYEQLTSGLADGVVDNERVGMTSFSGFNWVPSQPNSIPYTPSQIWNALDGKWGTGQSMLFSGYGLPNPNDSSNFTMYLYPGESDFLGWANAHGLIEPWSEVSEVHSPGDRNMLLGLGATYMEPGGKNDVTIAMVFAQSEEGENSVHALKEATDAVQAMFDACFSESGCLDLSACNYNENAVDDDGSCVGCEVLASACGVGTVWDAETQTCIVANPSDLNYDGCVDVQDFMGHLAAFGSGCEEGVTETPWQCGDPVGYQGYDYATVLIGDQCWFAENLRAENYRNGEAIPAGLSNSEWAETAEGAVSVYDGDMANLSTYGRLYNWYAVDDDRSLCPSGWHAAADNDWISLVDLLGGDSSSGIALKSQQGWNDDGDGNDSVGFSALPGGVRAETGVYLNKGAGGYWWTSSPSDSTAYSRDMQANANYCSRGDDYSLSAGFSVRCIKD